MGPLAQQVVHLVGTAPDKRGTMAYNEPTRLWNYADAMMTLDSTGNRQGSLPTVVRYLFEYVKCALYVTVVEVGANTAVTEANVIGGVDSATGAIRGLETVKACPETPTIIAAPGFHSKAVGQKLALIGRDETARNIAYKINDKTTQANFLNKHGVVTIAHTRMGGFIGNLLIPDVLSLMLA
ncbi:hypothetical protein [Photobacterium kishitanii]|uniref:hypothetical protein n=1 Tax=Photobacterium kishitanii TaxID=318456 RepID=UPI001EFD67D8|nr:hypothetical protein [Photobacterium kishitanii]